MTECPGDQQILKVSPLQIVRQDRIINEGVIKGLYMQLKDILENIPLVLQYFVPGFVTLSIFSFFSSKELKESQSGVIISAVVSYVLIAITELFADKVLILGSIRDSVLMKSGVAIIIGSIGAIICALVFHAKWFSDLLVKWFNKTPNDNIWMDIIDFKKGSNLKIYERGKNYYITGHHYANEEKGNDSWFAVTAYSKKSIENDEVIEDHSLKEKDILAVRLSDVDHMEIFN